MLSVRLRPIDVVISVCLVWITSGLVYGEEDREAESIWFQEGSPTRFRLRTDHRSDVVSKTAPQPVPKLGLLIHRVVVFNKQCAARLAGLLIFSAYYVPVLHRVVLQAHVE